MSINTLFRKLIDRYQQARQIHSSPSSHKADLLRQRDEERTSGTGDGLLHIALQPANQSVNSFTAADPAKYYQKGRAWDNM